MEFKGNAQNNVGASVKAGSGLNGWALARGFWTLRAYDPSGILLFEDEWENEVVTEGKNHLLDSGLGGTAQIATWYVGLTDGTPTTAAGDTMSSHAGWGEVTAYDEAARVTWSGGSASSGSIDNSGSKATFTINADSTTIGGAFLTSDNTKGGSTGTLYAVGAFSGGDIVLNNGSTLDVTATFSV